MVQVPLLVVNPGAKGSVLHAGQKHTDTQATETVLITKVEFPVRERRTGKKVPSMCSDMCPTLRRSVMVTCPIAVVPTMHRQTVVLVRNV